MPMPASSRTSDALMRRATMMSCQVCAAARDGHAVGRPNSVSCRTRRAQVKLAGCRDEPGSAISVGGAGSCRGGMPSDARRGAGCLAQT